MHMLAQQIVLVAQRSRLESLGSGLRGRRLDSGDWWAIGITIAVIVLVLWGLSWAVRLQERQRRYCSPALLFLELCRAHGLHWRDRWLLWRIARAQRLRNPACLFLEPQRLEAENLSPSLRPKLAQIQQLAERLFAGIDDEDDPEDEALLVGVLNTLPERVAPSTPLAPQVAAPVVDLSSWLPGIVTSVSTSDEFGESPGNNTPLPPTSGSFPS